MHEIGHALGLSHPFDGPYYLPYSVDDTDHTVMSYEWIGAGKSTYQAFDLLALQWLYGGDGLGGQYGINSTLGPGLGTAGNDTLNGDPLGISNNDTLTGQAGNDLLSGLTGNDRLEGGNGNDTLDGGTGNDTLTGGAGNDTYLVDAAGDVLTETSTLTTEIDLVRSTISLALNTTGRTEIENLLLLGSGNLNGTGNSKGNTLTGNAGVNVLSGLDGADTLLGLAGNDSLSGGTGNDSLDGGTGNDTLTGGAGNDTYLVDATGDVLTETSTLTTEIDLVRSTISLALNTTGRTEIENLLLLGSGNLNGTGNSKGNTLTGNAGVNVLNGLDGADTLLGLAGNDNLSGGNGNDSLDGGSGNDTLTGGTGNDTYLVDAAGDVLTETSTLTTEIDLVRSTISLALNTTGRTEIESLVLLGSSNLNATGNSKGNTLTGNAGVNVLSGLDGADTLLGLAGNDSLSGGNGNDSLDGGSGNDTLVGGTGNDTYLVDAAGDVLTETSTLTTEIDLVRSTISLALNTTGRTEIENLQLLGSGNLNGTGNAKANDLSGTAGNNSLFGLDGADTLRGLAGNDQLEGGNGNDVILGGIGKDILMGGSDSDRFVFSSVTESTVGSNRDVVSDLRVSEGDRIDLQAIDARTTLAGDQAFSYIGTASFAHIAGQLKFGYDTVRQIGTLAGDVNGDAIADFEVQLTGVSSLPSGNLIL